MNFKPNLIYVFADQLGYNRLGFNGDNYAKTPELDGFADECCLMDNCFSGHPVCAPYRASLFTGKYTTSTGMVINEIRINPNHHTFADVLDESGYETAYIGKWHMYANQLGRHFNVKNSYIPKGPDRLGFNDYFAGYNFHHKYYSPYAYYHLDSPEKIYCSKYEPDEQTDIAIEQIRRMSSGNKPFALFLSIGTPHDPWIKDNVPEEYYNLFKETIFPVPPNYRSRNDPYADSWAKFAPGKRKKINDWKQIYYAMVTNLDYNFGRLRAAIKQMGLDENTIIVFTSDHGEMFGAQGRHAKNIFYNEAVHTPFMIKFGNNIPIHRNRTCLNTVDIMPTLLSIMGLQYPDSVQGKDISHAILNNSFVKNDSLMMGTGPTAVYGDGKEWRGLRSDRYTYAVYRKDGKEFLFDDIEDPFQLHNLAENEYYDKIKDSLRSEMQIKMDKIGDEFRKNSYYKKYWVKNRIIKENLIK